MMCQALELFQEQHKVRLERVTQIPLEGEGTISKRVEKCVHLPYRVIFVQTESFLFIDCTTI
jgi:hypothetical protein